MLNNKITSSRDPKIIFYDTRINWISKFGSGDGQCEWLLVLIPNTYTAYNGKLFKDESRAVFVMEESKLPHRYDAKTECRKVHLNLFKLVVSVSWLHYI